MALLRSRLIAFERRDWRHENSPPFCLRVAGHGAMGRVDQLHAQARRLQQVGEPTPVIQGRPAGAGTLAMRWLSARGRVQAVPTQRRTDRGGRYADPEAPPQLTLAALVAQRGFSLGPARVASSCWTS
jgi:hypothetical protein